MDLNAKYEELYSRAVTEVVEAMNKLKPSNYINDTDRKKTEDYVDRWADVVRKFAPPAQFGLDMEAVEAIRRSYQKQ